MTVATAAAGTAPRAYVVVGGDVERDREVVLGVWRGNLGRQERLESKFDWFYGSCPWGAPLLQLLRHELSGAWVGVAAAGPRRMARGDRVVRAGVLVDLAVAPQHRSLGPALTLQKAVLEGGKARFDVLYGFPNPKAAAVFKRAGYAQLGEMVRLARVVRHGTPLERVLPIAAARASGWSLDAADWLRAAVARRGRRQLFAAWASRVDERFDALWASSDHGTALLAPRDAEMLRWRFDAAPSSLPKTRYLLLGDSPDGALSAWFACQTEGTTLHVRDFWSSDAAVGVGRPFVDALLRAAREAGHAVVSVEHAGLASRRASFREAGFVERSRRPVFGAWRDAALRTEELHLTSADEDE